MKSVLTDDTGKHGKGKVLESSNTKMATPKAFCDAAKRIVMAVRNGLGENEVRALSADKVASPVLQVRISYTLPYMPAYLLVAFTINHSFKDVARGRNRRWYG